MFMKVFKLTFCRQAISSRNFWVSHRTSIQSSTFSLQVGTSSSMNCSINCRKLHMFIKNSNSWTRLHTKPQSLFKYHNWKTQSLSLTFILSIEKTELSYTRSVSELLSLPFLQTYTATIYLITQTQWWMYIDIFA